jgi:ABC-type multidrug transport system fused ATPase/permease subunit
VAIEQRNLALKHRRGAVLGSIEGNIEFVDVTFAYNAEQPVFNRLSMVIPRGKLVAVVGRSGVGKSTLGYLLTRLYDPDSGEIRINGCNIQDYSLASLRSRIGYVEQTPTIFNGTVAENIRLGTMTVTDDQVRAAAEAVGIHDFILTMPNGYDSQIEDHGATLSGGQRQRIALARALVRRPDLYIIDEGTSALDRASESVVLDTMRRIADTSTVLFITHRITSTEGADLIYEFRAGEAVLREFHEVA